MISVKKLRSRKGFTMIELLTSVAVTAIIISVLIGMTRIAMDAWKDSRDKTKASRLAKEALETMSKDLEGIVIRSGNNYEWAFVKSESSNKDGPLNAEMSNPTEILFFTGATDRYDGKIGTKDDKGGDVSTVAYRIVYQDQLNPGENEFPIFALYRDLVNPDETFKKYLSEENLMSGGIYNSSDTSDQENFLVENIFDLTITFIFEYQDNSGQTFTKRVPVTADGSGTNRLRIFGDRVEVGGSVLNDPSGNKITRLAGCELSVLVLTDSALTLLKNRNFSDPSELSKFLNENGFHYSKSVILPRP
ncbi:hypothetical protein Rhal01_01006 [Rubritalea halochordaticola]|uniref:Prepilin-type N-terminal cleavage/methylation domain-containing protein n=1 Tax=Rubritalea halochordaticola TaxID=714537 RepID=A0ABP9V2J1_9BACT